MGSRPVGAQEAQSGKPGLSLSGREDARRAGSPQGLWVRWRERPELRPQVASRYHHLGNGDMGHGPGPSLSRS